MKRTIRLHATGGLGNQLFIWNAGHILAIRYEARVRIFFDPSSHKNTDRPILLNELSRNCSHAIKVEEFALGSILFRIIDKISRYFPKIGRKIKLLLLIFEEKDSIQDIKYPSRAPYLVRGNFQRWKDVESAFDFWAEEVLILINRYLAAPPISKVIEEKFDVMHIRRGDYKLYADYMGVLSFDFYREFYNTSQRILVCTDDVSETARIQSEFPKCEVLNPTDFSPWETLSIMSRASNIIGANSTFSWWGVFFGSYFNKSKISLPHPWHKGSPDHDRLFRNPTAVYMNSIFE